MTIGAVAVTEGADETTNGVAAMAMGRIRFPFPIRKPPTDQGVEEAISDVVGRASGAVEMLRSQLLIPKPALVQDATTAIVTADVGKIPVRVGQAGPGMRGQPQCQRHKRSVQQIGQRVATGTFASPRR